MSPLRRPRSAIVPTSAGTTSCVNTPMLVGARIAVGIVRLRGCTRTSNGRDVQPMAHLSDLTQERPQPPKNASRRARDRRISGKPLQFITGSEGGVVRSTAKVADISPSATRAASIRGPRVVQEPAEQRREPARQHEQRMSTLQFQSLSASAQRPRTFCRVHADNGTFQYNGSPIVWPQEIYGDGGQSGFNVLNDALRFTFTGRRTTRTSATATRRSG